jgi:hypothetical protein
MRHHHPVARGGFHLFCWVLAIILVGDMLAAVLGLVVVLAVVFLLIVAIASVRHHKSRS